MVSQTFPNKGGNTSNLAKHLKDRHPAIYKEFKPRVSGVKRCLEILRSCSRELREQMNELKLSPVLLMGPQVTTWCNVAFIESIRPLCECVCHCVAI